MSEIKHNFTAGKMNKDVDERLVKNGEYRDAKNIQVRTTDGGGDGVGDSGTVQNLQGNSLVGTATGATLGSDFEDANFISVGSIADEKTDSAYFFYTNSNPNYDALAPVIYDGSGADKPITGIDTIVEENLQTGATELVFVDKWLYHTPISFQSTQYFWFQGNVPTGTVQQFQVISDLANTIRKDSQLVMYDENNIYGSLTEMCVKDIKQIAGIWTIQLYEQVDTTGWSNMTQVFVGNQRVLKFGRNNHVNGINIIDDLLFWTDGNSEPKKINITRSKEGTTSDGSEHTLLKVSNENDVLTNATNLEFTTSQQDDLYDISNYVTEKDVTVLRPAPKTPPTIHVETVDDASLTFTSDNQDFNGKEVGDTVYLGMTNPSNWSVFNPLEEDGVVNTDPPLEETNFQEGDIILVTETGDIDGFVTSFKLEVIGYVSNAAPPTPSFSGPTNTLEVVVLSIPEEISTGAISNYNWAFTIETESKPKFELKFARFGYRYKYEDGEYSAFSPWSEIAFDPGIFDYDSKKGYNLGMVNTIQKLLIKDFIPYYTDRALDIKEVDILYKSTDSPNVYTVKTIRKEKDPEWELCTPGPDNGIDDIQTGALELKTENIHKAVAANQTLRTYDNVPRLALAQEITGSRILYGNYIQGFDIKLPVSLSQVIDSEVVETQPKRSVKTIREYKVGMVFGDIYGRETPVITGSTIGYASDGDTFIISDDFNVPKSFCAMANYIKVKQEWEDGQDPTVQMEWMDYVKYYIKETSNEYYNLVLDRWYYARNQDNIWLSFPSADRNKVDLETYLLLKKEHGGSTPVLEPARYKVIAIENEAPDFIKIDNRNMGYIKLGEGLHTGADTSSTVGLFTDPGQSPNNNEPNLLTDTDLTEIIIPEYAYKGELDDYGLHQKGTLMVRVAGRTMSLSGSVTTAANTTTSGDFVKVTHHHRTVDNDYRIVIEKSFGESANMLEAFTTAGFPVNTTNVADSPNDLQYFLEFQEAVVENKPEFDGRFFVLIEKDEQITQHIEKIEGASINFVELSEFGISYVDTQIENPAQSGPYSTGGGGFIYNDTVVGTYSGGSDNTLTDTTNSSRWWGWGVFPMVDYAPNQLSPMVTFFAMGCNGNGSGTGHNAGTITAGQLTRDYWTYFYNHHSSDSNGWDDTQIYSPVKSRIFLDGARAHRFNLEEFDSNNVVYTETWKNDEDGNNGGFVNGDGLVYQAINRHNYKPTALDQGHAANGLGRMIWSKQTLQGNNDDWGTSGAEIRNWIMTEGTYFQFKNDTSNNGEPHVYKVVHRDPTNPSFLIPPHTTTKVKNYSSLSSTNGSEIVGIRYDTTYCDSTSGTFGGQNAMAPYEGPWHDIIAIGQANAYMGVDSILYSGPDDLPGGVSEIQVSAADNNEGDCYDVEKHKRQRTCGYCDNNDDDRCSRVSVRFEFRKIDPETGVLTNDGITDLDLFDPRGEAKHDGTVGSIDIQIMKRSVNASSLIEVESDRSVWETEPKEGTELDIYYEASHAIPMKLSKGNTLAFAPLKSIVSVIKVATDGSETPYDLIGNGNYNYAYGNSISADMVRVGGAEYLYPGDGAEPTMYSYPDPIIYVESGVENIYDDNVISSWDPHIKNIGIGDYMVFTHKGGLKTKSEVLDFYKFADNNVTLIPQTRYSTTLTLDGVATDDYPQGTLSATSGGGFDEATDMAVGMNVIGNGVPSGIFVTVADYGTALTLNDTSWMTFGVGVSVQLVAPTGYYQIDRDVYKESVRLGWHNCYSFGNGVESDRIRDDFNAPQIDNGNRVSATVANYGKEEMTSGLIFSGLYNSTSGVNDLNEFNMGEGIIKNLNPEYGSIQALKTRDTNVVAFCEDRILQVQANKEAVFMADNDPNIVATDRVLGTISTFKGNYGISKNPESVASDHYRIYFTDSQRGAVLRLSQDGLTPISNVGMKTWFRKNLRGKDKLLGTYDDVNGEYNLTIYPPPSNGPTVSFNEASKGWVSFKSFAPDEGVSVSGAYITSKLGGMYRHYVDTTDDNGEVNNRNLFYGATEMTPDANSTLTVMFNEDPGMVKTFRTMSYEGSQARVPVDLEDDQYYNIISDKDGWWVSSINTNLDDGKITWFIDKEKKWFNKITGVATTINNIDTSEFTVQGIGFPVALNTPAPPPQQYTLTIENNTDND